MLTLALGTSLTTAWMTSEKIRARLIADGREITENLARQSILALLYGTAENAAESLHITLSFPDVRYAAIYDKKNKVLAQEGDTADWAPSAAESWNGETALLGHETPATWDFIAPVYGGQGSGSPFAESASKPEFLGYVHVAVGKQTLHHITTSIFTQNITMAAVLSALLLLLLRSLINKITRPLQELSGIMNRAELGESCVRAAMDGPQEVTSMAHAFNSMMSALDERDQRLRRQNDNLESEVALRTHELVLARDAALAASRHKSEFLANMSHELRTPLNAIIGYSDILIEEMEDAAETAKSADLNRVRSSALHLLSLINSILDLAKIESGRMELMIESTDLTELLGEINGMMKPLMHKNNNHFEMEITDSGEPLFIDVGKLRQVLLNLLSNANKFTENGHITLQAKRDTHSLIIAVNDTGIGISHDKQRHIFEEFRQVDMSITRKYGGTGLGLTISQRFCKLMNGTIEVESEPGRGSCFTVTIPLPVTETSAPH